MKKDVGDIVAKQKYVLIPSSMLFESRRFYVAFKTPDLDKYFYMSRQKCKRSEDDDEAFVAALDPKNKYNHKLFDVATGEEEAPISDMDIFEMFTEVVKTKEIKKVLNKNKQSNLDDLEDEVDALQKDVEILKLKIELLESKLK